MMYCTVADVIKVVELFETDWDDEIQTIPSAEIELYITEATEEVRAILATRYRLATIDSLDPLPYPIIYITKIKAAQLVLSRIGPTSVERNKGIKELITPEYNHWYSLIQRGLLLDRDGTAVSTILGRAAQIYNGQNPSVNQIPSWYSNLPPGQYRWY